MAILALIWLLLLRHVFRMALLLKYAVNLESLGNPLSLMSLLPGFV